VAAIVNAWLLYRGLSRDGIVSLSSGWTTLLGRIILATTGMIACLWYLDRPLDWWLEATVWDRSCYLGMIVSLGAIAYFVVLGVLGTRPSHIFKRP
ncbi:uncharacterized protein METZ01_LOCUS257567, partial [marine metagenome]